MWGVNIEVKRTAVMTAMAVLRVRETVFSDMGFSAFFA
jgi:hypothetical protein